MGGWRGGGGGGGEGRGGGGGGGGGGGVNNLQVQFKQRYIIFLPKVDFVVL